MRQKNNNKKLQQHRTVNSQLTIPNYSPINIKPIGPIIIPVNTVTLSPDAIPPSLFPTLSPSTWPLSVTTQPTRTSTAQTTSNPTILTATPSYQPIVNISKTSTEKPSGFPTLKIINPLPFPITPLTYFPSQDPTVEPSDSNTPISSSTKIPSFTLTSIPPTTQKSLIPTSMPSSFRQTFIPTQALTGSKGEPISSQNSNRNNLLGLQSTGDFIGVLIAIVVGVLCIGLLVGALFYLCRDHSSYKNRRNKMPIEFEIHEDFDKSYSEVEGQPGYDESIDKSDGKNADVSQHISMYNETSWRSTNDRNCATEI